MLALKTFLVLVACAAVHGFQSVPSLSGASPLPRALRPSFAGSLARGAGPVVAGSDVDGRRQRILLLRGTSAATMQLGEKNTGGTSVLERPTVTTANPSNEEVVDPKKPYHVLLFNDVGTPPSMGTLLSPLSSRPAAFCVHATYPEKSCLALPISHSPERPALFHPPCAIGQMSPLFLLLVDEWLSLGSCCSP